MQNPSTQFLHDINAANASAPSVSEAGPELDEGAVLAAIKSADVNDVASLASKLDVGPKTVGSMVDSLASQGLVEMKGGLELSESGERALRYLNIAKF